MSLELSNQDLRTLIDVVTETLQRIERRVGDYRHAGALENLRVRLDSELARREPGATVLEHTERVRELVMRWRELASQVEAAAAAEVELKPSVFAEWVELARDVHELDCPVLLEEVSAWAIAHRLPGRKSREEAT